VIEAAHYGVPVKRIGRWLRANAEPTRPWLSRSCSARSASSTCWDPTTASSTRPCCSPSRCSRRRCCVTGGRWTRRAAAATVRSVRAEFSQAYAEARRDTERWLFKGSTGGVAAREHAAPLRGDRPAGRQATACAGEDPRPHRRGGLGRARPGRPLQDRGHRRGTVLARRRHVSDRTGRPRRAPARDPPATPDSPF
jgi:hypothetical protein